MSDVKLELYHFQLHAMNIKEPWCYKLHRYPQMAMIVAPNDYD